MASVARTLRIRRYVQSHTVDDPLYDGLRTARTGMHEPFDGIASLWWDSREDLVAAMSTDEDAPRRAPCCSRTSGASSICRARRSGSARSSRRSTRWARTRSSRGRQSSWIKFCYLLQPKAGMSQAACHKTWNMEHGYLIRRHSGATRFARYIQTHTLDDELNDQLRQTRGGPPAYAGLTEAWFDRYDLVKIFGDPRARARAASPVPRGRKALHRLHALDAVGRQGDRVHRRGHELGHGRSREQGARARLGRRARQGRRRADRREVPRGARLHRDRRLAARGHVRARVHGGEREGRVRRAPRRARVPRAQARRGRRLGRARHGVPRPPRVREALQQPLHVLDPDPRRKVPAARGAPRHAARDRVLCTPSEGGAALDFGPARTRVEARPARRSPAASSPRSSAATSPRSARSTRPTR